MTWFLSLNPLFVIAMTPPLLAYWRRRADAGRDTPPARRMAIGALVVAAAYVLLAAIDAFAGGARVGWPWLAFAMLILTFGELYILPTGLGLFAKLAPPKLGATTVASWYLAVFSGSLLAGVVGTLWTHVGHATFFLLLAALAVLAAGLLLLLDRPIRRYA
jgi:POT family proton-dependent oligopeptide transporter